MSRKGWKFLTPPIGIYLIKDNLAIQDIQSEGWGNTKEEKGDKDCYFHNGVL